MKRMLASVLFLLSNGAFAQSDSCGEIASKADASANQLSYPANKVVVGQGKLHFHTAPVAACQSKEVFVIPGDVLKVIAENAGWYAVSYTNPGNGRIFTGWLKPERLEPVVQQAKVTAKWCEEITVSGSLVEVTASHFNGSKFSTHVLRLQQPLELLPPDKPCEDGGERVTVKEVQLVSADEKYVNKLISVTGRTAAPQTAYHIRPVLLEAAKVKETGL